MEDGFVFCWFFAFSLLKCTTFLRKKTSRHSLEPRKKIGVCALCGDHPLDASGRFFQDADGKVFLEEVKVA